MFTNYNKLPELVKMHIKNPNHRRYDANCWNTTIRFFKPDHPLRWEECYETEDWLKSETISLGMFAGSKQVKDLKYGDILSIWHGAERGGLMHTAIYIGDKKFYHKDGDSPYEITDYRGITDHYSGPYMVVKLHEFDSAK